MAIDPRSSRFWQESLRHGLLDDASLRSCWDAIPEAKREQSAVDRRLARQAIMAGHLTLWQAQQVLNGRGFALKIDKYVLLNVIGQGGMGRVFLARDTRLKRRVALKILSRERLSNPRHTARFLREAKIGAQLQHDNLVRIYDEGEDRGLVYLVMEYIEGRNVSQLLTKSGPIAPSMVALIGRQVALGLEHARLKGLIHRDVNPQNILVTRDGTAKLTDLGLAIDLGDPDDVVTRDGATVGTFDYISPEQARHPRSVDSRSDLYSLGCSLYHMLAGRVPFPSASLPEKLYAHQLHAPEPLADQVPGLPSGLAEIVHRLMAKAPGDRFPTPLAVAEALEPFAEGAGSISSLMDRPPAGDPLGASHSPVDFDVAEGPSRGQSSKPEPAPPNPSEALAVTRTASVLKPTKRPADSSPDTAEPVSDVPEAAAKPPQNRAAPDPGSDFGLPIDLGPAPTIGESLAGPRGRHRGSSAKESGELVKAARVAASTLRWPGFPRRLPGVLTSLKIPWRSPWFAAAAAVLLVAAGGLAFAVTWSGGDGGQEAQPIRNGQNGGTTSPSASGVPAFAVARRGGGAPLACQTFQDALSRAPNNGGVVFVGATSQPIRFGPNDNALLVPHSTIVIRPYPGTRPNLTVELEGTEPMIRNRAGALTLEDLTVLVRYTGDGTADEPRPPLIDSDGPLILRRCVFDVRSSRGRETRVVQSEGQATTVAGCLFRGFDCALDYTAYGGITHQISDCIFSWPRGADDIRPGWPIRVVSRFSVQQGPPTLSIDRCTVLRATGLVNAVELSGNTPLRLRVTNSAIRVDHLIAWGPPGGDDSVTFPKGISWEGVRNTYDVQSTAWVVDTAEGLNAPERSPSNLDSWSEALGELGDDGSTQAPIEFDDEEAMDAVPVDPSRFKARSAAGPVGADPAVVGPPSPAG